MAPAEAEAYEAPRRALGGMMPSRPSEVGQAESEYNDRGAGLARVKGEIRSSIIIDPPDGRLPYTLKAIAQLQLDKSPPPENYDSYEVRPGLERCLTNQAAGAPIFGGPDANLMLIVQTPDSIAILTEKNHDVRVVRLDGRPPLTHAPADWLGDSVGRWEGGTLVVETARFKPGTHARTPRLYVSGSTTTVERFTRLSGEELLYEFAVTDHSLFTQTWRGETTFRADGGQLFEYACHEGNYGLPDILSGARQAEKAVP